MTRRGGGLHRWGGTYFPYLLQKIWRPVSKNTLKKRATYMVNLAIVCPLAPDGRPIAPRIRGALGKISSSLDTKFWKGLK